MSTSATKAHPTREAYLAAFEAASQLQYPSVDDFERRCGCALDTARLLKAAAVLACPVKAHAPHWQHGRVIYAVARQYLFRGPLNDEPCACKWRHEPDHIGGCVCGCHLPAVHILDVGTAKGYSALCLQWAVLDSSRVGLVTSVDVISPREHVTRNTIAEVDGLKTLAEILEPWPEARAIQFVQSTGIQWLEAHPDRIHVAFIDGKHTGEVVRQEGKLLAERQQSGDVAIFDDCQIPGVSVAVVSLEEWYRIEYIKADPREYAIARRR